MKYRNPQLQDRLAAEYVLGTLTGRARQRFERLLQDDSRLQAAVAQWSNRLDGLNEELDPVTPPARVWRHIEEKIPQPDDRLRRSMVFWRRLAGIAASFALLAVLVAGYYQGQVRAPQQVVFVTNQRTQPVWVVKARAAERRFHIKTLVPTRMPASKVCVMWLVWDDGRTRPVGVLSDDVGETSLPFPEDLRDIPANAEVAVTVEQADSALDRPRGDMIFKGPWVEL